MVDIRLFIGGFLINFRIVKDSEVNGPKNRFSRELLEKYPQLREEVENNDGLLHLDMSTIQRHAEQLCEDRELEQIGDCFEWINTFYSEGHSDLVNAINVSFLEYFEYQRGLSLEEFEELMPKELHRAYVEQMEYMENLANNQFK